MFDRLLSPQQLGPTRVRNRIFNPPHGTTLGRDGEVTDDLIAYHRTRARGGAGLIVLEGMTLHPSYGFAESFLYAGDDRIVDGLGRLGFEAAVARDYPVIFGTLFIFGLMSLVVGILSDLMYVIVDPRIDFESREG